MNLCTVTGSYFNTENTILAACDRSFLEKLLEMCEYYDRLLSKTVPGSDVWKINSADGIPVKVSEHTIKLLQLALEMHGVSGGRFNIAIGAISKLWCFAGDNESVPDNNALKGALEKLDCTGIQISGRFVTAPRGMQIDLGGIAKGYIADRLAEYLRENGVKSALINLGGNVMTIGKKPDGQPWKIGLQVPCIDRNRRDDYWSALDCIDESVVTSGTYERGFVKNGKWYHHILDPVTGYPAKTDALSVTVCASSSFLADALTTPMLLLGAHQGLQLASRYNVEAAYYLNDNRVLMSRGMEQRLCN